MAKYIVLNHTTGEVLSNGTIYDNIQSAKAYKDIYTMVYNISGNANYLIKIVELADNEELDSNVD